MKKWIVFSFHTLGTILAVVLIVGNLFFREHTDYLRIITSAIFIVTYFISLKYYFPKQKLSDAVFEEKYKGEINGAFSNDQKKYKKLIKAARFYGLGEYQKALKILPKLERVCDIKDDFFAVYFFMGVCYHEIDLKLALDAYIKALKYNDKNAKIWINIGVAYAKLNYLDLAYEAFLKAISLGDVPPAVYTNMACILTDMQEPEEAIKYAEKGLSLNSKISDGYYAMAISYKMLGNEEEAERYCKLLAVNGGNADYVRSVVSDTPVLYYEEEEDEKF